MLLDLAIIDSCCCCHCCCHCCCVCKLFSNN